MIGHYFSSSSDSKAFAAERAIRSIKTRMAKAWTHQGDHKWLAGLTPIVDGINGMPKRALFGRTPAQVLEDPKPIYEAYKRSLRVRSGTPKYKTGDRVRIVMERKTFGKGYDPVWSEEVFVIARVLTSRTVPAYNLRDEHGKHIVGIYYEEEISKTQ